jgi:hypothetical protein
MAKKVDTNDITGFRRATNVAVAVEHLREARDLLVNAGAVKAAKRVRLALRSAEGAQRNADRIAFKEGQS